MKIIGFLLILVGSIVIGLSIHYVISVGKIPSFIMVGLFEAIACIVIGYFAYKKE
jgi:hypothetical protein